MRIEIDSGGDDLETDGEAAALSREIIRLDVERVERGRDAEPPIGARGDGATVGALVVALANSAVLVAICEVVRTWVVRRRDRTATIRWRGRSLTLTGADPEAQKRLVDGFFGSLAADGDDGIRND